MFPAAYFAPRMFAPRYFPEVGGVVSGILGLIGPTAISAHGPSSSIDTAQPTATITARRPRTTITTEN